MKFKEQIIYDINSVKFKYLEREENTHLHRVNIIELNKRLNETEKSNFYSTILVSVLGFACLAVLLLISIKV